MNKKMRVVTVVVMTVLMIVVLVGMYKFDYLSRQAPRYADSNAVPAEQGMGIAVRYLCTEGKTIRVVFYPEPDAFADLALSDGRTLRLPKAVSASGARYALANETFVFWSNASTAFVEEKGVVTYKDCLDQSALNKKIGGGSSDDGVTSLLSEQEACAIAEKFCIKGNETLAVGTYNEITKTWWFDAYLNAQREGCNPACVVSEETKTAEINWRCTGLLPEPSEPVGPSACGVANCHGLDIVCGTPVEMCTMMYQLGDKCREFAKCGVVDGVCQLIENAEFTACKSCAQKCEKDFPNDPGQAFSCESQCGE